jgi:calcineurin-like phosphoesterase family protein
MANVLFCSDLHFGHKNIGEFRKGMGIDSEEMNRWNIIDDWNRKVTKRDVVYVLGDAAFTMETVSDFDKLAGTKILVRGNHDLLDTQVYLKYFEGVYGLIKYKEFWLSHAPIHPDELRGRVNLHGHVHFSTIDDRRYFNCCPENVVPLVGNTLISLEQIRNHLKKIPEE